MIAGEFERFTGIFDSWKFGLPRLTLETEEPKGLLYHYTTPEGLLGILESESIRATHIRYLNDRTELKHALSPEFEDLMLDALFPFATGKQRESFRQLRRQRTVDEVFVASFTDDGAASKPDIAKPGDRLSQWRAYSNSAGGFSLGFDSKLIMGGWKSARLKGIRSNHLLRCRYGAEEKREAARRIGNWGKEFLPRVLQSRLVHFRKEAGREPNEAELQRIELGSDSYALGATDGAYFTSEAARFKDEAFAEEVEWRIVLEANRQMLLDVHCSDPSSPTIHFRPGRFGVTPYIDLPLRLSSVESPLRKVVVGPSQHADENVDGVRLLLETKGIKVRTDSSPDGVEVVSSKTPYRNW